MERNESSRQQYAHSQFATPQQPSTSSYASRTSYGSHSSQSNSTQNTPHYTTTPQQPSVGSVSSGSHFHTPTAWSGFRSAEQSPIHLPLAGRNADNNIFGIAPSFPGQVQALSFTPDIRSADAPRQQEHPSYQTPFTTTPMYQVPPASTHSITQSSYDQVSQQQHQQRSGGVSESFVGSSQYGISSLPSSQYYLTGGPPSALSGQHIGFEQSAYQAQGASSTPTYGAAIIEPAAENSFAAYSTQTPYAAPSSQGLDQIHVEQDTYHGQLRTIFNEVHRGALRGLDEALLSATNYRLTNIEALSLHLDVEDPNDEGSGRRREEQVYEWDMFNRAWLTMLQKQLDFTQEILRTGQGLREPHSMLDSKALEHLAQELVKLCDGAERYGLVDYQTGVAEDEIIDLILRCLALTEHISLQENDDPAAASTPTNAKSR